MRISTGGTSTKFETDRDMMGLRSPWTTLSRFLSLICPSASRQFLHESLITHHALFAQVALLGKHSKDTPIKEVATMGANLVIAHKSDSVQECMSKMVDRDIRHLPVVDDESGQVCIFLAQFSENFRGPMCFKVQCFRGAISREQFCCSVKFCRMYLNPFTVSFVPKQYRSLTVLILWVRGGGRC